MKHECIFCQIIAGQFNTDFVYEDENVVAFADIAPVAPVHYLIVPRRHIADVLALSDESEAKMTNILLSVQRAVAMLARKHGVDQSGFRLVTNCGKDAGQSVDHLHYHLIGGRQLAVDC